MSLLLATDCNYIITWALLLHSQGWETLLQRDSVMATHAEAPLCYLLTYSYHLAALFLGVFQRAGNRY